MTPYEIGLKLSVEKDAGIADWLIGKIPAALRVGYKGTPIATKGLGPKLLWGAGRATGAVARPLWAVDRALGHMPSTMTAYSLASGAMSPSAAEQTAAEQAQLQQLATMFGDQAGAPAEQAPSQPTAAPSSFDWKSMPSGLGFDVSPLGGLIGAGLGATGGMLGGEDKRGKKRINPMLAALLLGGAGAIATPHIMNAFSGNGTPAAGK